MRTSMILAAAGIAALAVPAGAAIDPALLKQLRAMLDDGQAKSVLQILETPNARENWEKDPKALAAICSDAAWNTSDLLAQRDDAVRLVALLEEWATSTAGSQENQADAHWALGHARVASGRVARATGGKDLTAEPWSKAADAFEKAYEIEAGTGAALAEAAEALAEASDLPGADAAALLQRANAIAAKATGKHADSVPVLKAASILDLVRARRCLAGKDKGGAEGFLEQGLARLTPRMKGGSPDLDLATAYNEIVAFLKTNAKDLKKPKGEFVAATQKLGINLRVDMPVSRYWSLSREGDRLFQFTPAFEALRSFVFDSYAWDTNWRLADGTRVGGDNQKGLATNEYEIGLRGLKTVKSKKAPIKGRLNGRLDEGYAYEAEGIERDGDFSSERTWFFKSKAGHMTTFRVTIYDHKEDAVLDAVSRFVLDSIREVPRK